MPTVFQSRPGPPMALEMPSVLGKQAVQGGTSTYHRLTMGSTRACRFRAHTHTVKQATKSKDECLRTRLPIWAQRHRHGRVEVGPRDASEGVDSNHQHAGDGHTGPGCRSAQDIATHLGGRSLRWAVKVLMFETLVVPVFQAVVLTLQSPDRCLHIRMLSSWSAC